MPVISMFYGIIVKMYREKDGKHHLPHIHAEYSGYEAVVSLDGEVIEGSLPKNKMKMLEVWMDIHKEELEADWNIITAGEKVFRIDPLK